MYTAEAYRREYSRQAAKLELQAHVPQVQPADSSTTSCCLLFLMRRDRVSDSSVLLYRVSIFWQTFVSVFLSP